MSSAPHQVRRARRLRLHVVTKPSPLAGVTEASGVAFSRRTPGILWSHNDSGAPILFAFDVKGASKGRVEVNGAAVEDWEDLAVGPCPEGSCLFIADIGDNNRSRRQVTVYRVPEPRPEDRVTQPAEKITLSYPDGRHDAEALFLASGRLFIVSKADAGATAIYGASLDQSSTMLELVAKLPLDRVTGAGTSPDGTWAALRTNHELLIYRTSDLIGARPPEPRRVEFESVGEPQGEGVAFGADGRIYLVGEGGGAGGIFTLTCPLR